MLCRLPQLTGLSTDDDFDKVFKKLDMVSKDITERNWADYVRT